MAILVVIMLSIVSLLVAFVNQDQFRQGQIKKLGTSQKEMKQDVKSISEYIGVQQDSQ